MTRCVWTILLTMCLSIAVFARSALARPDGSMSTANLRTEYRNNPAGLGTAVPRFSWELRAQNESDKGLAQQAYQILAASSADLLTETKADLWNTGRVSSRATNQIEYGGRPLHSRSRVWWTVRVWDQNGKDCGWAAPGQFSVGLLEQSDWTAEWIGHDENPLPPLNAEIRQEIRALPWIRTNTETARTPQRAVFSRTFQLPPEQITEAWLAGTVDQIGSVRVNDKLVGEISRWDMIAPVNVASALRPGSNELEIDVVQDDGFTPAVTGLLFIRTSGGTVYRVALDKSVTFRMVASDGTPGTAQTVVEERARPWGSSRNTEHFMSNTPYLRREFAAPKAVKQATLYATALGVYWCELNGKRVGNDELTPGWTDYSKRVYHQTYDVTTLLRPGANAIGIVLGDGWYAGLLGYTGKRHWYGGPARFKGQLEIEYTDGTRQVISSDAAWRTHASPIVWSDLYLGSGYDSRMELPGWSAPGFDARTWTAPDIGRGAHAARQADVTSTLAGLFKDGSVHVKVGPVPFGDPAYGVIKTLTVRYTLNGANKTLALNEGETLILPRADEPGEFKLISATFGESPTKEGIIEPQPGEPVRRFEEVKSLRVSEPRAGKYVFDLGQNIVGFARLQVKGKAGQKLTVRHAEMLNPDGSMYTSNLRGATATDYFWLNGREQTLEPKFTFHGFRYVEISGLDSRPDPAMVTGIVIHTDMERSGTFECSNELVNTLYHNIIWGQKGNYLEVPTDCPQRDERLGWTGDAQFFISTAAFNFDVSSFMSRWLKTLAHDSQLDDGTFAHVAPRLNERGGSTAWGDAAIVCTHAIYQRYGDTRIVQNNYGPMKAYMAWLETRTKDGISHVGGFGDWLNLSDPTDSDLMDTSYRIELLGMMEHMAAIAGQSEDAPKFAADRAAALTAFRARFVQSDGSLKSSGQTGYALGFTSQLMDDKTRGGAVNGFVKTIENKNWHLATGFIGTPRLLPALHAAGRDDVAYRILLNTDYPSWLYQVKLGATTMWERWDGWTPENGFSDVGMNSFNHYAFGSVGDYLFKTVAGINADGATLGEFRLEPVPGPGLDFARATYRSPAGAIHAAWKRVSGGIEYDFTIPPNTRVSIVLPKAGTAAAKSLPSGKYHFFESDGSK